MPFEFMHVSGRDGDVRRAAADFPVPAGGRIGAVPLSSLTMPDPATVITISELNRLARSCLEREFPLSWVSGEVSNLTRATSGHVYFTLKDSAAQVRCVMFRSRAQSLPWRLENGHQVEAQALVSLYEPRGDFQLTVEGLRRAGLGRLYEAFARLRDSLDREGLFRAERKQPIPRFPRCIGIVCSPRAAALRDVLTALRRRAPHLPVVLYPSAVQGDGAAAEIATAIGTADARSECDVLLVVRGGGSIEDLWSFNEEVVARAIVACKLPVICGVGHETDTTIADFVADLRAPTPTAAAEFASQGWHEAATAIAERQRSLVRSLHQLLERRQQAVDRAAQLLVHPAARIARIRDQLAMGQVRLESALRHRLAGSRERLLGLAAHLDAQAPDVERAAARIGLLGHRLQAVWVAQRERALGRLAHIAAALDHLNPETILARGFAIVRDGSGRLVSDATSLAPGQTIDVRLARGEAGARIIDIRPAPPTVAR